MHVRYCILYIGMLYIFLQIYVACHHGRDACITHVRDRTHSVWHNSFYICICSVRMTELILYMYICDRTHSVWHDRRGSGDMPHMCDITHSYVGHDSFRVILSQISRLERKRGQYQHSGFVRVKRQRNVASKRRHLRNIWKEPCRGCGFVTFVTFLHFSDILGFAQKTKDNTYRGTKP